MPNFVFVLGETLLASSYVLGQNPPFNNMVYFLIKRDFGFHVDIFQIVLSIKSAYEPSGPSGRSLSRFP